MNPAAAVLVVIALAGPATAAQSSITCQATARLMPVPGLWEASGIAVGSGSPARVWLANDSEEPILYTVDQTGQIVGRAQVANATVDDWEDLAAGACPSGRCLFIGDIGDNASRRSRITIYRVPEPPTGSLTTIKAEAFHATYPDGPHDSESLFVDDDGRVFVITKGRSTDVYRFPASPAPNSTSMLEKVAHLNITEPATGAAISTDRTWVVVRSNRSAWFYRMKDFVAGKVGESLKADLRGIREPQGEAIAFGPGNTIYLAGEGGSKGRPGTLTEISCQLPR